MKKFAKICMSVLCVVLCVCMLTGCNKYNSIKKAFEDEGYAESNTLQDLYKAIQDEIDDDIVITVHAFSKGLLGIGGVAVVFEFKSTDDMKKAVEDSEKLKALISDISKSDYVNGNCVLAIGGSTELEIFKKA